jgi:hypothetical protein
MSEFTRRSFIGKTAVAAGGSCRCEGLQTCLSYSLAQDRWLLGWCCVNEMSYRRLFGAGSYGFVLPTHDLPLLAVRVGEDVLPTNSLEAIA